MARFHSRPTGSAGAAARAKRARNSASSRQNLKRIPMRRREARRQLHFQVPGQGRAARYFHLPEIRLIAGIGQVNRKQRTRSHRRESLQIDGSRTGKHLNHATVVRNRVMKDGRAFTRNDNLCSPCLADARCRRCRSFQLVVAIVPIVVSRPNPLLGNRTVPSAIVSLATAFELVTGSRNSISPPLTTISPSLSTTALMTSRSPSFTCSRPIVETAIVFSLSMRPVPRIAPWTTRFSVAQPAAIHFNPTSRSDREVVDT